MDESGENARMRVVVRSLCLLALLAGVTSAAHSQQDPGVQPAPGGGVNFLNFGAGSPAPTNGGVAVSVSQKAALTYTCTKITLQIIRTSDSKVLDSIVFNNPAATVNKSFTGLGNSVEVRVQVDAVFQSGSWFDFKDRTQTVVTK